MEEAQIIALLNSGCKTLSKAVKTGRLPHGLEIEICNLCYDTLSLLSILEAASNQGLVRATTPQ